MRKMPDTRPLADVTAFFYYCGIVFEKHGGEW
jgi:hypothetical protein